MLCWMHSAMVAALGCSSSSRRQATLITNKRCATRHGIPDWAWEVAGPGRPYTTQLHNYTTAITEAIHAAMMYFSQYCIPPPMMQCR